MKKYGGHNYYDSADFSRRNFSIQREISTGHRMLYSGHPKRTVAMVFLILTANDESTGSFMFRLPFAARLIHKFAFGTK
jgi:hypothetical protein